MNAIDLFAGPGGWEVGARDLDLDILGVEWDADAVATRKAARMLTVQADVAALDPSEFGPFDGLIASPPCQAWSMAGKGGGRRDQELCARTALELAAGSDTRDERAGECEDGRSILVVEPLRWALALRPRWIALEQVPPVLAMWSLFATILGEHGYGVWTGVLSAERYGVPQTRKRAILMAQLGAQPHPPEPTHQEYVFGEPQRRDEGLFGTVEPWVSMAEALGWAEGERAYRLARGAGLIDRHGERRDTPGEEPAPAITSKARTASWSVRTANFTAVARDLDGKRSKSGSVPYERSVDAPASTLDTKVQGWSLRANKQANAAVRSADEPAPTIAAGHSTADRVWLPTHYDRRQMQDPASVATGRDVWVNERPATTVAGDSRIFQPGGRHEQGEQSHNAIRVSEVEAAILQGFPPDFPWQGSRTARFQQIGNAIPPPLARAVLEAVLT